MDTFESRIEQCGRPRMSSQKNRWDDTTDRPIGNNNELLSSILSFSFSSSESSRENNWQPSRVISVRATQFGLFGESQSAHTNSGFNLEIGWLDGSAIIHLGVWFALVCFAFGWREVGGTSFVRESKLTSVAFGWRIDQIDGRNQLLSTLLSLGETNRVQSKRENSRPFWLERSRKFASCCVAAKFPIQ